MALVPEIKVMSERCVLCADCIRLCPQSGGDTDYPVFVIDSEDGRVRVAHSENCIACFTCVEFCRAAAIVMAQDLQAIEGQPDLYPARPSNRII